MRSGGSQRIISTTQAEHYVRIETRVLVLLINILTDVTLPQKLSICAYVAPTVVDTYDICEYFEFLSNKLILRLPGHIPAREVFFFLLENRSDDIIWWCSI